MAHKTFISYKYSEAQDLRDDIIEALGEDARYYQGETSESPDLTDSSTENIKNKLKDMIYDSSVTIVIISPNMTKSKWIDWEIEYSLKEITRSDKTSRTNGLVGVIMEYNGGYDWIVSNQTRSDGCSFVAFDDDKLYKIVRENRFNQEPKVYVCSECKTIDKLSGSYISLINQKEFLKDPNKYIDNAFDKSQEIEKYDIHKIRN